MLTAEFNLSKIIFAHYQTENPDAYLSILISDLLQLSILSQNNYQMKNQAGLLGFIQYTLHKVELLCSIMPKGRCVDHRAFLLKIDHRAFLLKFRTRSYLCSIV